MEDQIKKYREYRSKLAAYEYALWLISWDTETELPKKGLEQSSKQANILISESYNISSSAEYIFLVKELYQQKEQLDDYLKREITLVYNELETLLKVPKKEFLEYQELLIVSSSIWAEAKEKNDFALFSDTLEKIVTYNRQLTKYLEKEDLKGYDVLLDLYEKGMGGKEYDVFFAKLKEELVPFVLERVKVKTKINKKLKKGKFSIAKQKEFSNYLLKELKFDFDKGVLKTSVHPFTSNFSASDVRITTRYVEEDIASNIYSVIHEAGHAIYEQQIDPSLSLVLQGGASLGIHESQSRLYENMIGRSFAFCEKHFPALKNLFPKELKDVTFLDFYKYVNNPKCSLIRIEADELTYSLHIMIRYEIEKGLISGKIKVKDLPMKWNSLVYKYLGIKPKTDSEGVLQDIHWSCGSIGYFPTYALGSAYAAQILNAMSKDINIEEAILNSNIELINNWLKEHIHKYGAFKTPKELLILATKEAFNPNYFIEYLTKKYNSVIN